MTKNSSKTLPMSLGRRLFVSWKDPIGSPVRNAALAFASIFGVLAYLASHTKFSLAVGVLGGISAIALLAAVAVYVSAWRDAPKNGHRIFLREKSRALEAAGSEDARHQLAAGWLAHQPAMNLDGTPMNGTLDLMGRAYGVIDTGAVASPGSDGSWLAAGHEYTGPTGMHD